MNNFNKTASSHAKSKGFTIVELMIVIVLALFITAGIFTIFVSSKRLTSETITASESLENGAFAMQILVRDLKQSYFFAQATGNNKEDWEAIPNIDANKDCLDNMGYGSFPSIAFDYRPLWASSVPSVLANLKMDCINDAAAGVSLVKGSDYISIKRAKGFEEDSINPADYQADRYYLETTLNSIQVYTGTDAKDANTSWEYIHHVYYIDQLDNTPRLRRLSLREGEMERDGVLAEGIENMKFMFALDRADPLQRDGAVHEFVTTANVTDYDWDSGRVIGMKISMLVRANKKTAGYVSDKVYLLGGEEIPDPKDGFKRKVFSRVLMFTNDGDE